jgi:hypothetical protein
MRRVTQGVLKCEHTPDIGPARSAILLPFPSGGSRIQI